MRVYSRQRGAPLAGKRNCECQRKGASVDAPMPAPLSVHSRHWRRGAFKPVTNGDSGTKPTLLSRSAPLSALLIAKAHSVYFFLTIRIQPYTGGALSDERCSWGLDGVKVCLVAMSKPTIICFQHSRR